ncbi:MAG TPA: aspartyl protease family protein [Caulobacteraceae bacterium]|jgi:hypothetical protein
MRSILLWSAAVMALSAGAASAEPASPADQILAANRFVTGGDAWARHGSVTLTYDFAGAGLTGVVGTHYDIGQPGFVDSQDLGGQKGANGFDGHTVWLQEASGMVTPQGGGDTAQLAVTEAYLDQNLWWRPDRGGAQITLLPSQTDGTGTYDVLHVAPAGGKPFDAWFDAKSHLLNRTIVPQGAQTITTFFSDYQPTDGAQIAHKQIVDPGQGEQYRQNQTLKSAVFAGAQPASVFGPPPWQPNDQSFADGSGSTTVPFQLLNNHIYTQVKVNGKGPFLFIFDTGGDDILTPDTAKALGVASQGALPGAGAGDNVVDTGLANGVEFQVGGLTIKNQGIAVLPFESAAAEGFAEQGMIGFNVFRRFVTVIDYGKHTLTFMEPSKFDPKDAGVAIPFKFYQHLAQVEGTFEGIPGKFDIDTGSRVELTLTKPFVDAQGLMATHPKGVATVDGWGVGGPSRSYVTRGKSLTLGAVRVDDVVTGFGTDSRGAFVDPSYQGNVGTKLLKRFVVTIDAARQVMYLKPLPAPIDDASTFDRSGFWINAAPDGFKVVDVTASGAAASAGVKVGDEITAIDGVDAKTITVSDIRRRFRVTPVGTVVKLTVLSAGQSREVDLTLKDQI